MIVIIYYIHSIHSMIPRFWDQFWSTLIMLEQVRTRDTHCCTHHTLDGQWCDKYFNSLTLDTWWNTWQNCRFPEKRVLGLLQDQLHCWYWSCRPIRVCPPWTCKALACTTSMTCKLFDCCNILYSSTRKCLFAIIHQCSFDFWEFTHLRISVRSVKFVAFYGIFFGSYSLVTFVCIANYA